MTEPAKSALRSTPRSAARLAAVQALYQMDVAGTDVNEIAADFLEHRIDKDIDDGPYAEADAAFFRALVTGVVREQRRIDPLLDEHLAEGWRLARLESILRAILRAAAYELSERPDVPAKVAITEYVDVAHAFFEGDEPGVVNGILDRLARRLRASEFEQPAHG